MNVGGSRSQRNQGPRVDARAYCATIGSIISLFLVPASLYVLPVQLHPTDEQKPAKRIEENSELNQAPLPAEGPTPPTAENPIVYLSTSTQHNFSLSIFYLRFLSGWIAALSAMSTIPQGPVEARSLSSVTNIASNPPAYPRNPTHEKHEPLSLYIVRVPGSKGMNQFHNIDILLSVFRSRISHTCALSEDKP